MAARVLGQLTGRRVTVGAVIAAFAAVILAGTVFACTVIMGQLTLSPNGGTVGTLVTTSAGGLKAAPATYRLVFNDAARTAAGKSCMASAKVLKSSVPTDGSGSWSGVTVIIPARERVGVSQICGMENTPVKNQTATTHETFTVT